jgi:hypothetical protein
LTDLADKGVKLPIFKDSMAVRRVNPRTVQSSEQLLGHLVVKTIHSDFLSEVAREIRLGKSFYD